MNQRGWLAARIASAVCIACSICVKSMSGSLSSTRVLRKSSVSNTVIGLRFIDRYSAFFPRTKSTVWWV